MEKVWYIKIQGKREGPYTVEQLRQHKKVTPDTLVWDEANAIWVPIRTIPELQIIFKDPKPPENPDTEEEGIKRLTKEEEAGELVLQMRSEPPSLLFWLLVLLAILIVIALYRKV